MSTTRRLDDPTTHKTDDHKADERKNNMTSSSTNGVEVDDVDEVVGDVSQS